MSVLSARRADYNAQFLAARRASPELDEAAFMAFLSGSLAPLVDAVAALDPSALIEVTDAAYGVGLELLAQRLAGPRAHDSSVDRGFQQLFPALARLVVRAPNLVLPRLCNALHQLSTTAGARAGDWCAALVRLEPHIESVEALLQLGQVLAWLAGLAHYRGGALDRCRELPPELVAAALGVKAAELGAVLERLERDPWFVPSSPDLGFRLIGSVGAFRGFGGVFLAPPRVGRVGQALFVSSGDDVWLMALDAFGCTLHRARPEELLGQTFDVARGDVKLEQTCVKAFGKQLPLVDTGSPLSVVGNESTLLFTTAHSYAVTAVALERRA
ncbi:MAG TPA: hypothetical protein VEQ59_16275 [Polyangiaceae bacterium]|nr:hypothetical protein [Polyangiaceae bacterium]